MNIEFESLLIGLTEMEEEARAIADRSGRWAELEPVVEAIRQAQGLADAAWEVVEVVEGIDWSAEERP